MVLTWVEWHAALTHFPVALLLTGAAFDAGAVIWRKPEWRMVGFWMLVAAVVMSVPALASGWLAGDDLRYTSGAQPPVVFTQHRLLAFITSGLALLLLAWRVRARDNLDGAERAAEVVVVLLTTLAVGFTGHLGGTLVFSGELQEEAAPTIPADATPTPVKIPAVDANLVAAGEKVFFAPDNNCLACHKMNGKGKGKGPDLTHEARRHADIDWQLEHLKAPAKKVPNSTMPAYDDLPPDDLKALAAYMATRQ